MITLHDLIAYENHSYFESGEEFIAYRQRLRLMVGLSDVVLAISPETLREAMEQLGLDRQHCKLFANPLQHLVPASLHDGLPPVERPYCLIVGTDFRHKHVPGTVELFRDVVLPLHPQMRLVIAGPSVESGGSRDRVAEMLRNDARLAAAVEIRGPVSDSELQQLYRQASLCFYLSLQEGFGYIPYEAACWDCPTLVANTSVFSDCPDFIAIPPFRCLVTQEAIAQLIRDPDARQRNIAFWKQRILDDQRRQPGAELIAIYQEALDRPRSPLSDTLAEVLVSNAAGSVLAQTEIGRAHV